MTGYVVMEKPGRDGVADVTFVRAERLGFGPDAVEAAVAAASEALDSFAAAELKQAA